MSALTSRGVSVARLLPPNTAARHLVDLMMRPGSSTILFAGRQPIREFTHSGRLPPNLGVLFVPQQEAWIIERFGKFSRTLSPGLNFCIPVVDRIAYIQSLKEIPINIPDQPAITVDNVTLQINGVLFLKVFDPYQASYGIEDAEFAMTQLAQTTMRSELGKIPLDSVFRERDNLNRAIVEAINQASEPWGIRCLRYEIRDIILPPKIKDAMQTQVEADRRKRAAILESEGIRNSDINVAEGKKQAQILASEAFQREVLNRALGESEAMMKMAEAKAIAIRSVSAALAEANGPSAVSMNIAEKYIEAFGRLAKSTNTVILPAQTGDVAGMVAQALAIYRTVDAQRPQQSGGGDSPSSSPAAAPQSPSPMSPTSPPPSRQFVSSADVDFDPAAPAAPASWHQVPQPQQQLQQMSRSEQIERDLARSFGQFGGFGSGVDHHHQHQQQHQQQLHQQQQRDLEKFN